MMMEENTSYRQAGRESPGRIRKGYALDKPEKTPLRPVFGSQASRFSVSKLNTTERSEQSSVLPAHKILGCMGKSRRFKPAQYATPAPGPGAYDWQTDRRTSIIRSVFVSKQTRSVTPVRETPAPGQYDPKDISSSRSATSVFRSNSKRTEVPPVSTSPSPCQYTPQFHLIHKSHTVVSYKPPSSRRFHINLFNPLSRPVPVAVPGPGSYDIQRDSSNTSMPSAVFVSAEERFSVPNEHLPAPGTYDIGVKPHEKEPASGAVFRSDTDRFVHHKGRIQRPGPAFYQPYFLPKHRSFLLNLQRKWVS